MKKIYIVDDDRDMVDSLSIVLKSVGYDVACQYHDKNVVENTHAFDANLIILDVMFPENDISGFEIARELRKSDKTKHIQILLLSAINEKRIFPRAFSKQNLNGALLPVDDFVEKPIPPMDLLKKVRKMLGE